MAITSVTITQKNITDTVNLLSVHNPLVFLVSAAYTSTTPEMLYVDLLDETDTLLATFSTIPYSDGPGARVFAFLANDILKSYMGSIEDFHSEEKTLEYVEGITQEFTLRFYDPAVSETDDSVSFVAMHASRQFGDTPYLESIYTNKDDIYYAGIGKPVYAYVYNDSEDNVITMVSGELSTDFLLDYDGVALLDFDTLFLTAI